MSAHSWERTKYNQQQRQFKRALLCQSKSTHWLQAVKQRRKEVVGSGLNRRLPIISRNASSCQSLKQSSRVFFILLKFSKKKPKMIQRNFLSGCKNFHLSAVSASGADLSDGRLGQIFFKSQHWILSWKASRWCRPGSVARLLRLDPLVFLQAILELDYMFILAQFFEDCPGWEANLVSFGFRLFSLSMPLGNSASPAQLLLKHFIWSSSSTALVSKLLFFLQLCFFPFTIFQMSLTRDQKRADDFFCRNFSDVGVDDVILKFTDD